ncbi:uncharacterized protein LOC131851185 [Achroia grisella]|uniref:uncharacterized protein LOC131851185 n=1 Tax=Achroia grisella TaxID=688607 RepID=UPI0027D2502D|nr:uncharacterized protein LOC131851185 [Achroia grisella]
MLRSAKEDLVKVSGWRLRWRQFQALFKRQIKFMASKKYSFLLLQLVLPVLMACLFTKLYNDEVPEPYISKPKLMDFSLYNKILDKRALFNVDLSDVPARRDIKLCCGVTEEQSTDITRDIIHIGQIDKLEYNKYLTGMELNDTDGKVLYTTIVRHALPVAMNTFTNRLGMLLLSANESVISTYNHPIDNVELTQKIPLQHPKSQTMTAAWAITIIILYLATIINFVSLPSKERMMGTRHIHVLSGCPPLLHWATTLASHALATLAPLVLMLVAAALLDADRTLRQPGLLVTYGLIMFIGGLAFLSLMYCISCIYSEKVTGIILITMLIVFGCVTPTVRFATEKLEGGTTRDVAHWMACVAGATLAPHAAAEAALQAANVGRLNAYCALNRHLCPRLPVHDAGIDVERCCGECTHLLLCWPRCRPPMSAGSTPTARSTATSVRASPCTTPGSTWSAAAVSAPTSSSAGRAAGRQCRPAQRLLRAQPPPLSAPPLHPPPPLLAALQAANVGRLNAYCALNRHLCPRLPVHDAGFDVERCCGECTHLLLCWPRCRPPMSAGSTPTARSTATSARASPCTTPGSTWSAAAVSAPTSSSAGRAAGRQCRPAQRLLRAQPPPLPAPPLHPPPPLLAALQAANVGRLNAYCALNRHLCPRLPVHDAGFDVERCCGECTHLLLCWPRCRPPMSAGSTPTARSTATSARASPCTTPGSTWSAAAVSAPTSSSAGRAAGRQCRPAQRLLRAQPPPLPAPPLHPPPPLLAALQAANVGRLNAYCALNRHLCPRLPVHDAGFDVERCCGECTHLLLCWPRCRPPMSAGSTPTARSPATSARASPCTTPGSTWSAAAVSAPTSSSAGRAAGRQCRPAQRLLRAQPPPLPAPPLHPPPPLLAALQAANVGRLNAYCALNRHLCPRLPVHDAGFDVERCCGECTHLLLCWPRCRPPMSAGSTPTARSTATSARASPCTTPGSTWSAAAVSAPTSSSAGRAAGRQCRPAQRLLRAQPPPLPAPPRARRRVRRGALLRCADFPIQGFEFNLRPSEHAKSVKEYGYDPAVICSDLIEQKQNPRCYFCFDDYSPLSAMIFLIIQFLVYMSILIGIQCGVFNVLSDMLFNLYWKILPRHRNDETESGNGGPSETVKNEKELAVEVIKKLQSSQEAMVVYKTHKRYPKMFGKSCHAVKDFNIVVKEGESFGLLGVNGAGKSTTFKMLTAEQCLTKGKARVKSNWLAPWKTQSLQQLSYCPQFFGLDQFLTGRENMELLFTLRGYDDEDVKQISNEWIKIVGLERYADRAVSTYSGGCLRRLSAAAALGSDAPLVLLDEPTAGVDPAARRRLHRALRRLAAQRHRRRLALVLTSHSMDEMESLCDRIAIMVKGELKALDTPGGLRASYTKGHTITFKLQPPALATDLPACELPPPALATDPPTHAPSDETDGNSVRHLKENLRNSFNMDIKDEHMFIYPQTMLRCRIINTTRYSELFTELEALKSQHSIIEDYTVTETTLEEVFLQLSESNPFYE